MALTAMVSRIRMQRCRASADPFVSRPSERDPLALVLAPLDATASGRRGGFSCDDLEALAWLAMLYVVAWWVL